MIDAILVVDDSGSDRFLIKEAFQELGLPFEIIEAKNGDEAVRMADARRPGLVLMDLAMIPKDGLTALSEIREKHGDGIKVVIMTSGDDITKAMQAKKIGADAYMSKPNGVSCSYTEKLQTVISVFIDEQFTFIHFDTLPKVKGA